MDWEDLLRQFEAIAEDVVSALGRLTRDLESGRAADLHTICRLAKMEVLIGVLDASCRQALRKERPEITGGHHADNTP